MRYLILAAALSLLGIPSFAGQGQGPVDPGPIKIQDLNLGEHWFGPKVSNKDLLGKVVLVEIYGS